MEDDNYIPLSYISQFYYCERRAGLLMLEQQWIESSDTAKGRDEHKNVHSDSVERRGKLYNLYNMTVVSRTLELYGKCDLVEATEDDDGVSIPFLNDRK